MQKLYNGHLIAMIILFFMGIIQVRELQVVIANIEVTGFDPLAFHKPTTTFAFRALFFCGLTILVGYKTQKRMRITGALMGLTGLLFFIFGMVMLLYPQFMNILDAYVYWCFYMLSAIVLTLIAILEFESSEPIVPLFDDEILDDI